LDEIPIVDDQICATYYSWKENATSTWARSAQETIERQLIMDANREASVITLPQPNWNLPELDDSMDFEAPIVGAERASIVSTFTSVHNYSSEEIYRASNFLRDVVRPFLHDQCASTAHAGERKPFVYPTNDQHACMSIDQWRPFALWVLQTRKRFAASSAGSTCAPLRMIVSGEGGTGKSWLIQQILGDIRVVFGSGEARKRTLLMAHQGSAAFLIGGRTLSSALCLPSHVGATFRKDYVPRRHQQAAQHYVGSRTSLNMFT
jgi:hypothetical protein